MYAIIRRYKTSDAKQVARKAKEGFLPAITGAQGFLEYFIVDEGDGYQFSISLFEDMESAELSNKLAADWVREHRNHLPEPPEICSGEVLLRKVRGEPAESAA